MRVLHLGIAGLLAGAISSLLAPLSMAQSRLPITNPDAPKPPSCSVEGTVVQSAGSVPIKSAAVQLESVEDHTRTFSAVTDAAGRFDIKGIDAGGYRLRVSRNGFVTQEYGQRTPNDAGAILSLRPGQDMKDLLFRLLPSAVITGRIENEDGEPLPWVRVRAMRQTYSRGRRRLVSEVMVVTDDHGEYRLFGLRPGRYLISATYRPGQKLEDDESDQSADEADPGKSGYVPMYYPGSADPAKAVGVTVSAADEIASMDLMLQPATVYSIRGRVSNLVSRSSAGVILVLQQRASGLAWINPTRQTLTDKPDGTFEIRGVLPGYYTLMAQWGEQGGQYQARMPVDVGGADVDGLQLVLAPGMTVNGEVVWDPRPSMDKDTLRVTAVASDFLGAASSASLVTQNGAFALRNLPEGMYRLATFGQSADCYLKSIRYARMEVSDDEFNVIRGTQANLQVTISSRGAHVQGTVTTADDLPAVGVWVALIPDGAGRDEFHLYKQRVTDQYGRYDLRGIAPGDYKLFSWEQVEPNAWEDPEFLKQFEGKGETLSLQDGEGKQVDLVAIRTASTEQQK